MLYATAVFAPLLGALVAGLLGRAIGDRGGLAATILLMALAAVWGTLNWVD